jgi:GDP-L-fucose synthase
VYRLQKDDAEPILKVGWGEDLTIRELAELVMSAIGYSSALTFDHSKPDETPRKTPRGQPQFTFRVLH